MPGRIGRNFVVHRCATKVDSGHYASRSKITPLGISSDMKQILPICLALIPLAAVVGACVAVP